MSVEIDTCPKNIKNNASANAVAECEGDGFRDSLFNRPRKPSPSPSAWYNANLFLIKNACFIFVKAMNHENNQAVVFCPIVIAGLTRNPLYRRQMTDDR